MSPSITTWASQEPRHFSIPLPDPLSATSPHFDLPRNHILIAADSSILVYSLQDGGLIHSLKVDEQPIWGLDVYQDILVATSARPDNTCRIWDLITGECIDSYTTAALDGWRHMLVVKPTMVEFERNGTFSREKWPKELMILWTHNQYHGLKIWKPPHPIRGRDPRPSNNAPSPKPYNDQELPAHDDLILSLAARGRFVITGSRDCTARVWDIVAGDCIWVLIGHADDVTSVDIDQKQAYTGSKDATVRVWNLQTGECSYILQTPLPSIVFQIGISPSYLVSSYSPDGTLCIWDPISGQLNHQLPNGTRWFSSFQHDDRKILYGSRGFLKLCDIRSGKLLKDLLPDNDVKYVAFRGRFCVALTSRDVHDWLEVWDFTDEDGSVEEEPDDEDGGLI